MAGPLGAMKAQSFDVPAFKDRVALIRDEIERGKKEPAVRAFAATALAQRSGNRWVVAPRDYGGEVRTLGEAVRSAVRYTGDITDVETIQSAVRTLELKIGDCDDMAILLGSLLQTVGYPAELKVVDLDGRGWSHIYVMAGVPPEGPTEWIPLDPTVNQPLGWEVGDGSVARSKRIPLSDAFEDAVTGIPWWVWVMFAFSVMKILRVL